MVKLALEQLLNNSKNSSFILINDSVQFGALPLLTEFTRCSLANNGTVVVLLTETSPTAWLQRFTTSDTGRMQIIDAFTDPEGWDEPTTNVPNIHVVRDVRNVMGSLLSTLAEKVQNQPQTLILIDSLTPLAQISQYQTYQLVKVLESLTSDACRLVIGYHADIYLPSTNGIMLQGALNRLASVVLSLEALKEHSYHDTQAALTGFVIQDAFSYMRPTNNVISKGALAKIEWRRKSGKVQYETNGFFVDLNSNTLKIVPGSQLTGKEVEEKEESIESDLPQGMANLSFNLSLTEEQKKAKENLVLPYMKVQNADAYSIEVDQTKKAEGTIYYEPDAADDFDDEDPDDDLDI
ncbi:Elongator complex protein 5 [Radiomyces spectabilis]|uniref:Elongator complex protein 5 n=1 Tax=Radiomyces spectabilis TaxID=64574 RepID=UPI00221FE6C1|nr:Elongator complex protein 5 [Radiomyces spectabilis]KAI8394337.1 Elongator complex protein 5 [Radiomyces spectabilis]